VPVQEALDELRRCASHQFDPAVVQAFTRLVTGLREATATPAADALGEWTPTVPAPVDAGR
jgi:HD-GYP domain-containing protein (c-di-GMP phosphodiesterase class II)